MPAQNQLHLWDDRFLYITPAIQSGLTTRSSATLLTSASSQPFTLVTLDGTVLRCAAALVAPHVPRRLDADGCGLLSLNIDPASAGYRALAARLGTSSILPLDARYFTGLRDAFEGALHGQLDDAQLRRLGQDMVHAACGMPSVAAPLDARVARVLQLLRAAAGQPQVPLRELAVVACLSPDRLTHLFREQTGLSIKRYLLWAKVRRTIQLIASHQPLSDVALAGGFTDAAHMSRTFQRYFGLSPSFLASAGHVAVTVDAHAAQTWRA